MHLLPKERAGHRVIDAERICQAIGALPEPAVVADHARRFALLADPNRLALLLAIRAAEPISVSDLAAATGISDASVSQALRHLRANRAVAAERDGRVVRYRIGDPQLAALVATTASGSGR